MTDWSAKDEAIRAWVVEGTGLADGLVYFAQGKPRPQATHVALTTLTDRSVSDGWVRYAQNFLTFADLAVESVDEVGDTLESAAHARQTGDGPVRLTTTGVAPGGLAVATDYWVIVDDADNVQLATTFKRAMAGQAIDITDAGTGDHAIVDTATTQRQGEELTEYAEGVDRIEVQLQCIATPPAGPSTARAILSKLKRRSSLSKMNAQLRAAGLGLIGFETIQSTNPIANTTTFEPRAITVVAFHVTTQESSTQTVIAQVEVTNQLTGGTQLVPPDEA